MSRADNTAGLSSISEDVSKLLEGISLCSGDKLGKTWLKGCSGFSISINSSWLELSNDLFWSLVSGGDPAPLLSFNSTLGVSFSTAEDSGLSCVGLYLSLGIEDKAATSSWIKPSFSSNSQGSNLLLESTKEYMLESVLVLLISGDILDFSFGSVVNSLLSCFTGDLGAISVTGDEDLERPPLGDV